MASFMSIYGYGYGDGYGSCTAPVSPATILSEGTKQMVLHCQLQNCTVALQ